MLKLAFVCLWFRVTRLQYKLIEQHSNDGVSCKTIICAISDSTACMECCCSCWFWGQSLWCYVYTGSQGYYLLIPVQRHNLPTCLSSCFGSNRLKIYAVEHMCIWMLMPPTKRDLLLTRLCVYAYIYINQKICWLWCSLLVARMYFCSVQFMTWLTMWNLLGFTKLSRGVEPSLSRLKLFRPFRDHFALYGLENIMHVITVHALHLCVIRVFVSGLNL